MGSGAGECDTRSDRGEFIDLEALSCDLGWNILERAPGAGLIHQSPSEAWMWCGPRRDGAVDNTVASLRFFWISRYQSHVSCPPSRLTHSLDVGLLLKPTPCTSSSEDCLPFAGAALLTHSWRGRHPGTFTPEGPCLTLRRDSHSRVSP